MTKKRRLNTIEFKNMKREGKRIAMITAYDFPSALLAEQAGADMILVGDSLGMVVLGYESTIPVTVDDIVHHAKAVTRAAKQTFVIADLPFLSYHGSLEQTLRNAARLMQEGLVQSVKLEGGEELADTISALVQAGIPVMGHLGLTPQSVHQLGGYRVQGKELEQAKKLVRDAKALEQAGAYAIVLEMIPEELADYITKQISIPTISIGAGRGCDGQVLVYHDMLQYASPISPKFVKTYASIGEQITAGLSQYVKEVKDQTFPAENHVFHIDEQIIKQL